MKANIKAEPGFFVKPVCYSEKHSGRISLGPGENPVWVTLQLWGWMKVQSTS